MCNTPVPPTALMPPHKPTTHQHWHNSSACGSQLGQAQLAPTDLRRICIQTRVFRFSYFIYAYVLLTYFIRLWYYHARPRSFLQNPWRDRHRGAPLPI